MCVCIRESCVCVWGHSWQFLGAIRVLCSFLGVFFTLFCLVWIGVYRQSQIPSVSYGCLWESERPTSWGPASLLWLTFLSDLIFLGSSKYKYSFLSVLRRTFQTGPPISPLYTRSFCASLLAFQPCAANTCRPSAWFCMEIIGRYPGNPCGIPDV